MDINNNICIVTDENPNEVKAWIEKNDKQKLEGGCYPVIAYYYIFPLRYVYPTPERATVNKLVLWNASDIQSLNALAWSNLHKHGWKYAKLIPDNFMEEFIKLMFHSFGNNLVKYRLTI